LCRSASARNSTAAFLCLETSPPTYPNSVKKAAYDDRVERGLAQRALGYSYHAEKPFQYQGAVVKVQYVEHVPDVAAGKVPVVEPPPRTVVRHQPSRA
jgi:hypothetical protein